MTLFCRLMSRIGFVHKSRYLVALRERDEARRLAGSAREARDAYESYLHASWRERDDLAAELQSHRDEIARFRDVASERAEIVKRLDSCLSILDKSPYPAREELRRQAEMQKALRSL